jgi:drug/metabolite transporter (DMT)-like permease
MSTGRSDSALEHILHDAGVDMYQDDGDTQALLVAGDQAAAAPGPSKERQMSSASTWYGATDNTGNSTPQPKYAPVAADADADADDNEEQEEQPNTGPVQEPLKRWQLLLLIAVFVFCGTFSTITSKVMFQTKAEDQHGVVRKFERPVFQNFGMFCGMSLCLIVYAIKRASISSDDQEDDSTTDEESDIESVRNAPMHGHKAQADMATPLIKSNNKRKQTDYRVLYYVAAPAFCDFVATQLQNVGLLWLNASVWQMLRGSILLFTALVRWRVLKRTIYRFQAFAVFIVMCALVMIGMAAIESESETQPASKDDEGDETDSSAAWQVAVGIVLILVAQGIQSIQNVIEEHLLQDIKVDSLLIVGLEGVWGALFCASIAMPVATYTHGGHEGDGIHEKTGTTIAMLGNSSKLFGMFIFYVFVILGFNVFGMTLTQRTNSVTRNILDTIRTLFIWMFLTFTHYEIDDSLGEPWTVWSYMQAAGFLVLVFGLFTYNDIVRLPCWFKYPHSDKHVNKHKHSKPSQHGLGWKRRKSLGQAGYAGGAGAGLHTPSTLIVATPEPAAAVNARRIGVTGHAPPDFNANDEESW